MALRILVADDEQDMSALYNEKYYQQIKNGTYQFEFASNGKPSMKVGRFSPNLFVSKPDGTETQIRQLSVSESHKMLGCHKAPIGSQIKQKIVLKTKCLEFAKVVNCTALTRTDSRRV